MQDLRVAAVQTQIVWEDKQANYSKYSQVLASLEEVDLIVLPEMFQTGFNFNSQHAESLDNSPTLEWLHQQAVKNNAVITGSFMVKEDGKVFNRLVWMRTDGTYSTYDKRHLFSMSDEPQYFTGGDQKLMVELNGWKICPVICYDLRFPVWLRNTEKYDVLLTVANWPERRSVHWEKLLQARAIENQCFVIGVNRVGNDGNDIYHDGRSAIINPLGDPLVAARHRETVLRATLNYEELTKTRRYMPFLKDADSFQLL